jgi:Flp pilus assembly protein TadG
MQARRGRSSSGSVSLPFLVILVPVIFGLMGFALDLGRLYLVRGELNEAASAMALAAASQLLGTSASLGNATTVASQSLDNTAGTANKYNFGLLLIGQTAGTLASTINPAYYATVADATTSSCGAGTQADGSTARHAQICLTAGAPLLFWSLLTLGQSRQTTVATQAVAGISAPLCTACGIEPFAVAAISPAGPDFGFDPTGATLYSFAFTCTGTPAPLPLPGAPVVVPYVLINRYDTANTTLDETQQLYRDGAAGVLASTSPNPNGNTTMPFACIGISGAANETIWATAAPTACSGTSPTPASTVEALCGLYSRFDNTTQPAVCSTDVTDFADLSVAFQPDTDLASGSTAAGDIYSASYTGDGRRVITVAVVDALPVAPGIPMTVLGFRQFLLEMGLDSSPLNAINPSDANGRFAAQYIGGPVPVKQGYIDDRFQLGCPAPLASGPGKVVLHQ